MAVLLLSWTFSVDGQEGVVETTLADVGGVARARASPPCWASLQGEALDWAGPVCGYARVGITPLLCSEKGSCLSQGPRCASLVSHAASGLAWGWRILRPGFPVGSLLWGVVANDRHSPFVACFGRGAAGSQEACGKSGDPRVLAMMVAFPVEGEEAVPFR
jgi:hypothetical protein